MRQTSGGTRARKRLKRRRGREARPMRRAPGSEARRTLEPLERLLGGARAAGGERRAYGEAEAILGAAEQDLRRARAERELAAMQDRRCKAADAINAARTARAGDSRSRPMTSSSRVCGPGKGRRRGGGSLARRRDPARLRSRRRASHHLGPRRCPARSAAAADRGHDTPPGALRRNHHHPGARTWRAAPCAKRGGRTSRALAALGSPTRRRRERQTSARSFWRKQRRRSGSPEFMLRRARSARREVRLKRAEQAALQQGHPLGAGP